MDFHHIAGAENYFTPVLSNADLPRQGKSRLGNEVVVLIDSPKLFAKVDFMVISVNN